MRYSLYGQMSPEQMLPRQMSPWQLESVLDVPRNLPLKFHQNWVSNSLYIGDIKFVWVVVVIFTSNPTKVMLGWVKLWLSWGFDNLQGRIMILGIHNKEKKNSEWNRRKCYSSFCCVSNHVWTDCEPLNWWRKEIFSNKIHKQNRKQRVHKGKWPQHTYSEN